MNEYNYTWNLYFSLKQTLILTHVINLLYQAIFEFLLQFYGIDQMIINISVVFMIKSWCFWVWILRFLNYYFYALPYWGNCLWGYDNSCVPRAETLAGLRLFVEFVKSLFIFCYFSCLLWVYCWISTTAPWLRSLF